MRRRWRVGVLFAVMGLPLLLTGGMLALFLGPEYAVTSFIVGIAFIATGAVASVLSVRAGANTPVTFASRVPGVAARLVSTPTKIVCPSCGASPSRVSTSVTTCEYCGATFAV